MFIVQNTFRGVTQRFVLLHGCKDLLVHSVITTNRCAGLQSHVVSLLCPTTAQLLEVFATQRALGKPLIEVKTGVVVSFSPTGSLRCMSNKRLDAVARKDINKQYAVPSRSIRA